MPPRPPVVLRAPGPSPRAARRRRRWWSTASRRRAGTPSPSRWASAVVRQPGRVGADVGLGEQERGDRAARRSGAGTRCFCSGGAEQLDRLRHADRLVRRQQRAEAGVHRADQHQRPAVVRPCVRPRPPYSRGIFMPKAPSVGQALDVLVGDLRLALDPARRRCVSQTLAQPGQERLAALDVVGGSAAGAGGSGRGRSGRGRAPWRSSAASSSVSRAASATARASRSRGVNTAGAVGLLGGRGLPDVTAHWPRLLPARYSRVGRATTALRGRSSTAARSG